MELLAHTLYNLVVYGAGIMGIFMLIIAWINRPKDHIRKPQKRDPSLPPYVSLDKQYPQKEEHETPASTDR